MLLAQGCQADNSTLLHAVHCICFRLVHMHAERRLIKAWEVRAHKKGFSGQRAVAWIRRKLGPDITTWRIGASGDFVSSFPCVLCRRELVRFGFRLSCPIGNGHFFSGRLDDATAPASKLTTQQRLAIQSKQVLDVGGR
jgi:hypothetical protein